METWNFLPEITVELWRYWAELQSLIHPWVFPFRPREISVFFERLTFSWNLSLIRNSRFFWIPEALFFSRLWLEFCCKFWGLATFQRNDQKPKFLSRFRHFLLWKNSIGGLNWSNSAFSTRKLRSKGQDGSDCSSWDSGGSVVWTREDQRKPGYYVNNPNFSKFLHTKWLKNTYKSDFTNF